jgi:SAM-dependent methyltransferase
MTTPPGVGGAREYDSTIFEHSARWDLSIDPKQEERASLSLSLVPATGSTVLDAGCGNGVLTRRIASQRWVVGCDTSRKGLRDLGLPGVCGSLTHLPFKERSFDLVTAFEVLEHLPLELGQKACAEIARVSRQHILISVPNGEDLQARLTRCPACHSPFHVYNHLRAFDSGDMAQLVPGARLKHIAQTSHTHSVAERLPVWLRTMGLDCYTWAPNATCPRCRRTNFSPTRAQVWMLRTIKLLARTTPRWRVAAGWIVALYERAT